MALKLLTSFFLPNDKKDSEGEGLWTMVELKNENFASIYYLPTFLLPNNRLEWFYG